MYNDNFNRSYYYFRCRQNTALDSNINYSDQNEQAHMHSPRIQQLAIITSFKVPRQEIKQI